MARKKNDIPRRDEFLAAALRRFARQGYAATSTRDICADVGLAHSAIYNYFSSKEAMLLAIEEREMTSMQAGLDSLLRDAEDRTPLQRLEIAIKYTLTVAVEKREAWRLMAEMLRSLKPKHRRAVVARRDRYEGTIRRILEEAIATGELAAQDVQLASLYLFGMAESISGWFRPDGRLEAATLVDNASSFFFRAIGTARVADNSLQSGRSEIVSPELRA
jgi:AcrR family transcriptional regulator